MIKAKTAEPLISALLILLVALLVLVAAHASDSRATSTAGEHWSPSSSTETLPSSRPLE